MAIRLTMIATVFTAVIVVLGAAHSPLVVLGIPVAVLTGMAFAAPIAAFSGTQRTPNRFNVIFRFGITPLFLFSGTFFPIESLPAPLQAVAWLSPLWHGVDLSRGVVLGTLVDHPLVMAIHVVVLVAIVVIASWAAVQTIGRRLVRG
jgi:lipooligosaccharide transport system permease protein